MAEVTDTIRKLTSTTQLLVNGPQTTRIWADAEDDLWINKQGVKKQILTTADDATPVAGPATSTDNAVARFNGTGGNTIQNSVVTISDTGTITTTAGITAGTTLGTLQFGPFAPSQGGAGAAFGLILAQSNPSAGTARFDSYSAVELTHRSGMVDGDDQQTTEVDWTVSPAINTGGVSKQKIAAIETYLVGTTAHDRGGRWLLDTKQDGGLLANAIDVDQNQRVTFPGNFLLNGTATFTNTTEAGVGSGALVVTGGVDITKKLRVESATAATSVGTGGLIVVGGASVAGAQYVGGNFFAAASASGGSITIGAPTPTANSSSKLNLLGSNSATNWQISTNNSVGDSFEIMPSTVGGGTTFTTPSLKIVGTTVTLAGLTNTVDLTASGTILGSGGTAPSSTTTGSNRFTAGIATSGPLFGTRAQFTNAASGSDFVCLTLNQQDADNWGVDFTTAGYGMIFRSPSGANPIIQTTGTSPVQFGGLMQTVTAKITGLPAFASGDKYVVVDATGNLHVSALGPAS